jgi:hypothetical protein
VIRRRASRPRRGSTTGTCALPPASLRGSRMLGPHPAARGWPQARGGGRVVAPSARTKRELDPRETTPDAASL